MKAMANASSDSRMGARMRGLSRCGDDPRSISSTVSGARVSMAALGIGPPKAYDATMARMTRLVLVRQRKWGLTPFLLLVFAACQSQEPVASNPGDTTSNPGPRPSASCDADNGGIT